MRITSTLLAVVLAFTANAAIAQQKPSNENTPTVPQDEVVNLPAGDVQNVFFALAPVLGATAGVAVLAGGGGSATSTTSTTN